MHPLVKKDGLPELARKIIDDLMYDFNCQYDEKDSIGKRYRRQDAIGTPFCVTVDHDSVNDGCVTIRHRDTMEQQRVKIEDLRNIIDAEVNIKTLLKKLNLNLPRSTPGYLSSQLCREQQFTVPVPWALFWERS